MTIISDYCRAGNTVDFDRINQAALVIFPSLVRAWLPDGKRQGREWVCLNPRRGDRHAGSFSVNLESGKWADFAVGAAGGDPISLAAYVFNTSQIDAARALADVLGIEVRT